MDTCGGQGVIFSSSWQPLGMRSAIPVWSYVLSPTMLVVAKGVGVLATGHVLPARRTPTHPLRWLGFGRRCPVAILVQAQLYFVSLACPFC